MGSKGTQLKESKTGESSYQASPYTIGAGVQALGMAQNAANRPFETPVAPVAGFNQDQQAGFQGVRNSYNLAQPYFQQAADYARASAAPISASQVGNYLNPFASYALAGLNDTLGSQNQQLRGNLVQAAGGVGADRVAVAQAEKFRQDQLARGNLMSGFYQQALGAAEREAQRQGAASSLFGYFGPAAQSAALGSAGALINSGGMQQQQQQAELNAPYQNILAQIADPFQKSQFLASLTGGLAPAFGGTTSTQSQTYAPKPSMLSQVLGLGATALGAYMGMPGAGAGFGSLFGGGSGGSPGMQFADNGMPWQPAPYAATGGRVNPYDTMQGFDEGGDVPSKWTSNLEDRWNAASDPYPSELPENQVPLPRPRPDNPFSWLKQDEDSINVPPAYSAEPPRGGLRRPAPPPTEEEPRSPYPIIGAGESGVNQMAVNPWWALAYAGAKTAAGESPNALTNIGSGAAAGIEMLGKQATQANQSRRVDLEAKRLMEQATQHREMMGFREKQLTETTRQHDLQHNRAEREYRLKEQSPVKIMDPETLVENTFVRDPKDGRYYKIDPSTGEVLRPQLPPNAQPTMQPGEGTGDQPRLENIPDTKKVLGMSPEAVEAHAERYLQTGMFPPNLRGKPGQAAQAVITNRAMEIAKERGIPIADLPKRHQEFRAEQVAIQRFKSGPQGNIIRSFGVLADHIGTFQKLGEALKNGDVRLFNAISQEWAKQTGRPAPTNFDTAKHIIGTEIVKALGVAGAGTVAERSELGQNISKASSPDQILGAVNDVIKPLVAGQLQGLKHQFTAATRLGEDKFNEMLSPAARKFFTEQKEEPKAAPRRRKQGEFTYEEQPDGTWKAVQ